MVTPELYAYVRAQVAAGVAEKDIRAALLGIGWDAVSIQEAFIEKPADLSVQKPAAVVIAPIVAEQEKITPVAVVVATPAQPTAQNTFVAQPVVFVEKKEPTAYVARAVSTSRPEIPVTPTLRALTAIDSQFRAGVDRETIRTLLLGVGWESYAIDEAFLAVEWEQNILSLGGKVSVSPDANAPKISTIDSTLAQVPFAATKHTLVAIDTLLRNHVSKNDIRTLLLGVGWETHAIDEAFLAVEWRGSGEGTPSIQPEQKKNEPESVILPKEEKNVGIFEETRPLSVEVEPRLPTNPTTPYVAPLIHQAPLQVATAKVPSTASITITPAAPATPVTTEMITSSMTTIVPPQPRSKSPLIFAVLFGFFVLLAGTAYWYIVLKTGTRIY